MTTDIPAIRIENISKTFKSGFSRSGINALLDVRLDVARGEIFGLLGPNGAGKTTLIKILMGALKPSSGTAFINEHDIKDWRARQRIGFLPENHRFPPYQTGLQMLFHFGGLTGLSHAEINSGTDRLLHLVGMHDWGHTKIKKYSKGMMQRLGLAQALINDPEIVFLDEPTDGVDPIGRHDIRNILINLKSRGKTIFLNSHLLAEVESVCDRVAILDKGKLLKIGPVSGLIQARPVYHVATGELTLDISEKIKSEFPSAKIVGNNITLELDDASQINNLIDLLRDNAVALVSVREEKMSLEDSFMRLVRGEKSE